MMQRKCTDCSALHKNIAFCNECKCSVVYCETKKSEDSASKCFFHEKSNKKSKRMCCFVDDESTNFKECKNYVVKDSKFCQECLQKVPKCKKCNDKNALFNFNTCSYFSYCKDCRCATKQCFEMHQQSSQYCENCELQYANIGVLCDNCLTNKVGINQKTRDFYKFCYQCACKHPDCLDVVSKRFYCQKHIPRYPQCTDKTLKKCNAYNCFNTCHFQDDYCEKCVLLWKQERKDKCPVEECDRYKSSKHEVCSRCYNLELEA